MALLGADAVAIQVTTTSSTGSFRNISQQITEWSGLNFEANIQESHAMGDAWREFANSGFRQIDEISLQGFYDDDTSTGVSGIFFETTDPGAERVMKINWGTTNSYSKFDFLILRAQIMPKRGALTEFEVTIQPTGALTVVTT